MLADDDVTFLHRLADAADAVSRQHFRSEALRTTTKVDGTPVSEVDRAVEEAMLALVRAKGTDAVLGEEVGEQPGSSNRQWIFDGIDGTHNYADGRPGWGTIIALDVDGDWHLAAWSRFTHDPPAPSPSPTVQHGSSSRKSFSTFQRRRHPRRE
ncbi:MAG: hypothetical protein JJD93_01955 [Ilumatobacteraceae bacterium]|nr:hypothetical protein [Ilumatobacteraceae bacterium]